MSLNAIRKSKTSDESKKQSKASSDMIFLEPIIYFYSNPTTTGGNTVFYTYSKVTKDLLHNRQRKRNATCFKHKSFSEDNDAHCKLISWKEAYDLSDVSDFDLE